MTESIRFRRAIYRLWYICYLGIDFVDDFDPDEHDDDEYWVDNLKPVLQEYDKQDLSDLFGASVFLLQMRVWSDCACAVYRNGLRAADATGALLYVTFTVFAETKSSLPVARYFYPQIFSHYSLSWPQDTWEEYTLQGDISVDMADSEIAWGCFKESVSQVSIEKGFNIDLTQMETGTGFLVNKPYGLNDTCMSSKLSCDLFHDDTDPHSYL